MTNSEKLLSSFSENYFYKELVYSDLKFIPTGGTEIELADLIINLEDIILAIQLKERNEKDRTQDKNIGEKVSFINARGKKTIINPSAEVVPLVVFENDSIQTYVQASCRYRALTVCTRGYIVSFLPTTHMRL